MRTQISNFLLALVLIIHLVDNHSIAQTNLAESKPPTLKNGKRLGEYLRLGYKGDCNTFVIITVKFKITSGGFLDTLYVSDNAPGSFIQAAKDQLVLQNGKWNLQSLNGKPVNSKWLVSRYYVGGIKEKASDCTNKLEKEFLEAFSREEELFICDKKLEPPLKCLIDYVEGYDCYLYPPLLASTVR